MQLLLWILAAAFMVIIVMAVSSLTGPPDIYDDYYDHDTSGLFEED